MLYGAETWTLRRNEQKQLEEFEIWVWRRMEGVKWTDKIKNAVMLERVGEGRIILELKRKRKINWLGHWLRRNFLLKDALQGMVNGKKFRGRRRYQMIDNIMINGLYEDTKRKAEKDGACKTDRQNKKNAVVLEKSGIRKNNAGTDKEEGKKLVGPLAKKELPAEGCCRRDGKRQESSRQKISNDRQHYDKWTVCRYEK